MQPIDLINSLPPIELTNLPEIVEKAKALKTSIISISGRDLFGCRPEGYVFGRIILDDFCPDFVFSCNQLTDPPAKALIEKFEDPESRFVLIPGRCIVEYKDFQTAMHSNEDHSGSDWEFPNIKVGRCDQFYMYHRSICDQLNYALTTIRVFEANYVLPSYVKFDIENFQDNEAFNTVMTNKKEIGTRRTVVSHLGENYVLTLYKNIVPYKKGDKVRLTIMSSCTNNVFYARFNVVRKGIEINVYANYLNLV